MVLLLDTDLHINHFSFKQGQEGGMSTETIDQDQATDTVRVSDDTHKFLFFLKITFLCVFKYLGE